MASGEIAVFVSIGAVGAAPNQPMLLTVSNVSKAFGDNQVLSNVSLTMGRGDKRGLVGANGVGKSTLVKIVAGELEPDSGFVQIGAGVEIGYLPQVLDVSAELTVDGLMAATQTRVRTVERRLRELEQTMTGGGDGLDAALSEYGLLAEEFERLGGYAREHRVAAVLSGLGIGDIEQDRRVLTLSGGEKARAGLAALLLRAPDLLLLDEPTNHLDFAALTWLEGFLSAYTGGLLVISHDREFLNATVHAIVEIEEHSREAHPYAGNYDFFAAAKAQARARWIEDYGTQQEEIRALRRFIRGSARQVAHNRPPSDSEKFAYDAKGGRVEAAVSRNVRAAEERLRRIEADPVPKPPQPLNVNPDFDPADLVSKMPLTLSQVGKAFGGRPVLDDITVALGPRDRIVIVGSNGAGKSTLLKIMGRRLAPDRGEVILAASVAIGYLDQEQETLPTTGTLYEAYADQRIGDWEQIKVELLRYGLFIYPDLLKPVANLSVGQKRKLQIAQLIAARANLLLLDEPTNHISFDVLEQFEEALVEFPGPIVAISHDRRFIERVAQEVWELRDGHLIRYLGGWEEYRARAGRTVLAD